MSSVLSYIPVVNRLVAQGPSTHVDLPSVEIHSVETDPEKAPRTVKHLLRANHVNYSIIYHNLQYDNHLPHIVCSAYLLGANEKQLNEIFDVSARELEAWVPSPQEVTTADWLEFLGDRRYQRAYVDFFEDQLVMAHSYDWKKLMNAVMFEGELPLVNALYGGLGHPLIHFAYAYEMDSKEVGIESLALAAAQFNYFHKYLSDQSYTKPSPIQSTSPLELFQKIASDQRFDGIFKTSGFDNVDSLFDKHGDLVLEYWNAWTLEDPTKQFQESQEAAVAFLVASVSPGEHSYNFFVCHILTTSHAVRVLLPLIPRKFHMALVRGWWLLAIAVYVALLRPKIDPGYVKPEDADDKQWKYVEDKALNGPHSADAHFVKAIRAMREAARTWGDDDKKYLASAVKFADNFQGWTY